MWDTATGRVIGEPLRSHNSGVTSVAFSPDGRWLASGSEDKTVQVWDAVNHNMIGPVLRGHDGRVTSVALSPSGQCIVSASSDGTLRSWDAVLAANILEAPHFFHRSGTIVYSFKFSITRLIFSGPLLKQLHDKLQASNLSDSRVLFQRDDGWVVSGNGSLLLFIPLHDRVWVRSLGCLSAVGKRSMITFDFENFQHGKNWVQCYTRRGM